MTPKKRERFCEVLREGYSVAKAAQAIGITRQHAYYLRNKDEAFAAAWHDAYEAGTDRIEDVVLDRALTTSDTLAIVTLKARRPNKHIERRAIEMKTEINVTVQRATEELRAMPRDKLLAALELMNAPVIENESGQQSVLHGHPAPPCG